MPASANFLVGETFLTICWLKEQYNRNGKVGRAVDSSDYIRQFIIAIKSKCNVPQEYQLHNNPSTRITFQPQNGIKIQQKSMRKLTNISDLCTNNWNCISDIFPQSSDDTSSELLMFSMLVVHSANRKYRACIDNEAINSDDGWSARNEKSFDKHQ